LLAGVAVAFFLEYHNQTVRGLKDIEDFVGLKVIATVPRVPRRSVALRNYLARAG
jgi:capsular polysaccharide biosynthesis protein